MSDTETTRASMIDALRQSHRALLVVEHLDGRLQPFWINMPTSSTALWFTAVASSQIVRDSGLDL